MTVGNTETQGHRPRGRSRLLTLAVGLALAAGGLAGSYKLYREFKPVRFVTAPSLETIDFALPALPGVLLADGSPAPGLSRKDFEGKVTVLNVWASWCPSCRGEHPELMELARELDGRLVGFAHRDTADNAGKYLQQAGNPFSAVGIDTTGTLSSHLRVVGIPVTFVIDGAGRIVHRIEGGLDATSIRKQLRPAMERARAATVPQAG
jgi:cytochrome c biogenesis protein CcmG/thiol:disulfide interchange protein DsbE